MWCDCRAAAACWGCGCALVLSSCLAGGTWRTTTRAASTPSATCSPTPTGRASSLASSWTTWSATPHPLRSRHSDASRVKMLLSEQFWAGERRQDRARAGLAVPADAHRPGAGGPLRPDRAARHTRDRHMYAQLPPSRLKREAVQGWTRCRRAGFRTCGSFSARPAAMRRSGATVGSGRAGCGPRTRLRPRPSGSLTEAISLPTPSRIGLAHRRRELRHHCLLARLALSSSANVAHLGQEVERLVPRLL